MHPLDIIFKSIAILLSCIAIFQLFEVRKKRHIDMFWKIYDLYTSEVQKAAREDAVAMRKIIKDKIDAGINRNDIMDFYRDSYHKSTNESQKNLIEA